MSSADGLNNSSSSAASDLVELEELRDRTKVEGERLVRKVFPAKVIELDKLLKSPLFSYDRIPEIQTDLGVPVPEPVTVNCGDSGPPSKKRKCASTGINHVDDYISGSKVFCLPNGTVPANSKLVEIIDHIKPLIRDLVDFTNTVKMWITYMIPKIEDGNNFGVSVQEETMAEARTVETEAAAHMDQITRYYISRAKLVSKVAKYPHIDDYRLVVKELDEKQFMTLRLTVTELRNSYSGLHDVILKNVEKIKKPRNSNISNMF